MLPDADITADAGPEYWLRLQKSAIDAHSIVAITDSSGVITYVNDKFCAISKFEREELIGKTHRIINSGYHPRAFFAGMWRAISQGLTWRGEICNKAKDGSAYWVDTTIVPVRDAGGRIVQYVSIRTDITEQKRIEDLLRQTNAELEEFVYTASHDLKSPLLTIEGFSGFLKEFLEEGDTEGAIECVNRISEGVRRMRENIDDLLELSRIGRVVNPYEPVCVRDMLDLVRTELQGMIKDHGASITLVGEGGSVYCDPVRLHQLLMNLVSNAMKYGHSSDGACEIRVGMEKRPSDSKLFVSDRGPGVRPQYHKKVFQLFQRLSKDNEGTGVGLSIVQRIAHEHGGKAWIEETPGGGATFCVSFPNRGEEPVQTDGAGLAAQGWSFRDDRTA